MAKSKAQQPPEQKSLGTYRLEYEILPGMSSWTAFVIAFSPEEAFQFLETLIGKGRVHLTSIGYQCRIDGITPEVREHLTTIGVRQAVPAPTAVDIDVPKVPKTPKQTVLKKR